MADGPRAKCALWFCEVSQRENDAVGSQVRRMGFIEESDKTADA